MKHYITYIFLLVTALLTSQNADRKFISVNEISNGLEVHVNDGVYTIQMYTPEIAETSFLPTGETAMAASHAVVLEPNAINVQVTERAEDILLKTNGLYITITKSPFQISYYYKDKHVISEKAGYAKNDSLETIQFEISKDEVLYGGGARALGMNRRGHRLQLYNRAHYGYETHSELMNFTLPIVMSSNQYMVHFDNAPIGFLDLDSKDDNTLTYETISGRKTYQVIVGESWYDIVDNYTDLTGKQPMLPRWALGNFSSRFGYHSQKEVLETIDAFRAEEIPVDAIILDLYWFGKDIKGTMGNLAFDRDSFPNPQQMVKDLKSKNVETILITEPFMLTTSKRWDEAVEKDILAKDTIGNPATYDFYFGNTGIIDIYSNTGKQWFKTIYKDLAQLGVNGFWGDLGEPEVLPSWVKFEAGTADEVHNIYGHDWAKLVYESSLEVSPDKRPFILMRAGYSGSQRYGMVPWSGDVNRTWGGLQSQPEIALQMGLQGLAYMHSDLGGFAGANLDDELYVRWLQYGVFQPIYRPHAQEDVASEPVFRSEKAKELAKQAIELRYALLPYNYNLMFQNSQTGTPLMRPLFFEEPNNPDLYAYSDAYLWGKDILVAPILKAGQKEQTIYFPKHSAWFDFDTAEVFEGGQTKTIPTKEQSIPTFIRAGAFIPMLRPQQSTKLVENQTLYLSYGHHNSVTQSRREFYNDDGKTVAAYENRNYQILNFEATYKGRNLQFDFDAETGKMFTAKSRSIDFTIHNISKRPKYVKIDGKKVEFFYSEVLKNLIVTFPWHTSEAKTIKLKLKN
ncbi:TIM-barrel domain-containing protein [Psychroserpens algicola]|uniref:DUF4968 domain-containing protein n=1 Tax=Psychroserpens algicola TaxID=1719034 RepID=A0ABT0H4R9_9FLAO|nr:TIM-barrel domain-containing protein [Psychroserpens algicola]MCK8479371.1 DUF4968 domain-containing protein [Psychroserpens algicola]